MKTRYRLGSAMACVVLALVLCTSLAFGQIPPRTFYVDVQNGSDYYDGLSPTYSPPNHGPKQTISKGGNKSVHAAAISGDIIYVEKGTTNFYNENVVIKKELTFISTENNVPIPPGGVGPEILSWKVSLPNPADQLTFQGPFRFQTGLNLDQGEVIGGEHLTVGGQVTRTWYGSVQGQLNYYGVAPNYPVNFLYKGVVPGPGLPYPAYTPGDESMTAGDELPPSGDTASMGQLRVNGDGQPAGTGTFLTLAKDQTMNDKLDTKDANAADPPGQPLDLGFNTLTLVNPNAATTHNLGGDVSNGTLAFDLAGWNQDVLVTGNYDLSQSLAITATASAGDPLLHFKTWKSVGDVTGLLRADIYFENAGNNVNTIGNVVANDRSRIFFDKARTLASLTSNGLQSQIIINTNNANVNVNGDVRVTGRGLVQFNNAGTTGASTNIGGSVINEAVIPIGATPPDFQDPNVAHTVAPPIPFTNPSAWPTTTLKYYGVIEFNGDVPVNVTGNVINSAQYSGALNTGAVWQTTGQIRFHQMTQPVTIAGVVQNSTSYAYTHNNGTFHYNGAIIFDATGGNVYATGGFNNSASGWTNSSTNAQNNGLISIEQRNTGAPGTIGDAGNRVGPVENTSSAPNSRWGNGDIRFHNYTDLPSPGAGFWGTSVLTSGGHGGVIVFENEDLDLSGGMINDRTVAWNGGVHVTVPAVAGHIQVGTAATPGMDVVIGHQGGDLWNKGPSDIVFAGFDGSVFTVGVDGGGAVQGALKSTGPGTISIPNGTLPGPDVILLGGVEMPVGAGTVNFEGAGAAVKDVVVIGNTLFEDGIWNMATTAARNLNLAGPQNKFSTQNTSTDFSTPGMQNVTLLVGPSAAPAPLVANIQECVFDLEETVWYGLFTINNNTAPAPPVTLRDGNFRVLNDVDFQTAPANQHKVAIDNCHLFVGGLQPTFGPQPSANFMNTSGYTTQGNAFVAMNSQTIAVPPAAEGVISGPGDFGNLDIDVLDGNFLDVAGPAPAPVPTPPLPPAPPTGDMTGNFGLTSGIVGNPQHVTFNNTTDPPTIIRNWGRFDNTVPANWPVFASMVDVIYIGVDKVAQRELPRGNTDPNQLRNLTIATTNTSIARAGMGADGQGTIRINRYTVVNGFIQVNDAQALLIKGVDLEMRGPDIFLEGDIASSWDNYNFGGPPPAPVLGRLVLNAPGGTNIQASSAVPDIFVKNGSVGNEINAAPGSNVAFCQGLLGPDDLRGGSDDVPPGYSGGISFEPGGGTSSLTLNLGPPDPVTGSHLCYVQTAPGATLTLTGDLVQKGGVPSPPAWPPYNPPQPVISWPLPPLPTVADNYLFHDGGTINLNTFSYQIWGTNHRFIGGAVTTTADGGTLDFLGGNKNLFLAEGPAPAQQHPEIDAHVNINLDAAATLFRLRNPVAPTPPYPAWPPLWPGVPPAVPPAANRLEVGGNFTLTQGELQLGGATGAPVPNAPVDLWLTGNQFVLGMNGVSRNGHGYLRLNPDTPPMTMDYVGNPTNLYNFWVSNDVDLIGTGGNLLIWGEFLHDGGNFYFNSRDITIASDGADQGNYRRLAGTYDAPPGGAVTGYLIIQSNTNPTPPPPHVPPLPAGATPFIPGPGFSIPNLRIQTPGVLNCGVAGDPQDFWVTQNFDLDNGANPPSTGAAVNHNIGGARLHIADGAVVTWYQGWFDVAPVYEGTIVLNAYHRVNLALDQTVWPAVDGLVTWFNVWSDYATMPIPQEPLAIPPEWQAPNPVPAAATVTLPGSRQVNMGLTLGNGTVDVPGAATFTMADEVQIDVILGTIPLGDAPQMARLGDVDITYYNYGLAPPPPYITGGELFPQVRSLTITRFRDAVNQFLNILTPVEVYGTTTLNIRNNIRTLVPPAVPVPATLSVGGDVFIENESVANPFVPDRPVFPLATDPVAAFQAPLEFVGGENQLLVIPDNGIDLTNGGGAAASITLNKDNPEDRVTINHQTEYYTGDNKDPMIPIPMLTTGILNLVRGLFVTGDNILSIPAPPPGGGQGFNRDNIGGEGHVLGRVSKVLVNTYNYPTSTYERVEFPVGANPLYRPLTITFPYGPGQVPTFPNGLRITVDYMDECRQDAREGLPFTNDCDNTITDFPDFCWYVFTNQDIGQVSFDMECRADGFVDYTNITDPVIIRHHGDMNDINNPWRQQGDCEDYDNALYENDPTKPVVINRNSVGGLRTDGSIFALGLPAYGAMEPQHFFPVWDGNPLRPMTIYCSRAHIDGASLMPGDEIGVFDGDKCVGAVILAQRPTQANPVQIICSSAEDGLDNGFTPGNTIEFKVWDRSAIREYGADPTFYNPTVTPPVVVPPVPFADLGEAAVELDAGALSMITQSIELFNGWNIFSLAVTPSVSTDMLDIVDPILAQLIKVMDEAGNAVVKILGTWNNGIGDWQETEGYYIKVNADVTLNVVGTPVTVPLTVPFTNGWNISTYPCPVNPQNALDAFQPLIAAGQLEKVINESGQSIYRLFGTWRNFIGNLQPGEGYYVKVNADCNLDFDCPPGLPKAAVQVAQRQEPQHFHPAVEGNPYKPMSLYLTHLSIDGAALEAGDEVALLDKDQIVAAAVIPETLDSENPLELIAAMDDGSGAGFTEGNVMTFRIWKKASGEEIAIESSAVQFLDPASGEAAQPVAFQGFGTAAASISISTAAEDAAQLPADFTLEQNYPNPFNPSTRITFGLPDAAQIRLEIYDLTGHLVRTLYDGTQAAGVHTLEWNGSNDYGDRVASGVYFYRLTTPELTLTKKMIFTK